MIRQSNRQFDEIEKISLYYLANSPLISYLPKTTSPIFNYSYPYFIFFFVFSSTSPYGILFVATHDQVISLITLENLQTNQIRYFGNWVCAQELITFPHALHISQLSQACSDRKKSPSKFDNKIENCSHQTTSFH